MLHRLSLQQQQVVLETLIIHFKMEANKVDKVKKTHWSDFTQKMEHIGLTKPQNDSITYWACNRSQIDKENAKLRLLHPIEREIISVEAYGYLLEIHQIGLISLDQFELIIEESLAHPSLPVKKEEVRAITLKILCVHFSNFELSSAN